MKHILYAGMVACALGSVLPADAVVLGARPDLVRAVADGKVSEAKASWWGFDPEDATAGLQAAIDSHVPVLHVDAMAGAWIVRPLRGVSNQKIVFDRWVEVRAKKGAFLGLNDCLLKYSDATNVTLTGQGAVLRMNRWDYHAAPYRKGEWRHALSLCGCSNVLVEGLVLAESGGDGIYVSTTPKNPLCRNVTIRDCVCEKNYRQGISVISADGLLIERTVMRDTAGTAPQAGIDFEPNRPNEVLRNCVMRDCVSEGNAGSALEIYIGQFDETTRPVSIRIENCRLTGGPNVFTLGSGSTFRTRGYVRGEVTLANCLLEKAQRALVRVGSNPTQAVHLAFENCQLREGGLRSATPLPEVQLVTGSSDLDPTDGIGFKNVHLAQAVPHDWINRMDCTFRQKGITAIAGDVTLETTNGVRRLALDEAWRRSFFGTADPDLPSYLPPAYSDALKVVDAHPGEETPLARFRVRGSARYAFYAAVPMHVKLTGLCTRYGSSGADPWKVTSVATGAVLAQGSMPEKKAGTMAFDVPAAGFYVFEPGLARHHAFVLTAANVPMALEMPETGMAFMSGGATGYLPVSDRRRFYVYAHADGVEFLSARLEDPDGQEMWRQNQIEASAGWKSAPSPKPGLWRLTTGRPAQGCFEDHNVFFGGVPGWLFLSADRYWTGE